MRIQSYFPEFPSGEMGSAYSFLLKLLEKLDEESGKVFRSCYRLQNDSVKSVLQEYQSNGCKELHAAFSVLLEQLRECYRCKKVTSRYIYQRSISLDLVEDPRYREFSLESCLDGLTAEEWDTEAALHFCEKCQTDTYHVSKKFFKHISPAFVIYLQRYHSPTPTQPVTVNAEMNMSRYLATAGYYDLKAAIRHHGTSWGGHYTCYVRTGSGWYHVDDVRVETESSVQFLSACTLFIYVKRSR